MNVIFKKIIVVGFLIGTTSMGFSKITNPLNEKKFRSIPHFPKDTGCRDTIVQHSQKVAFLMVINFNASAFRWRTGYRRWATVEKVGENCTLPLTPIPVTYTYYFSNNKTQVTHDIVDVKVMNP